MSTKPFENLFLSAGAMKAGTTWMYRVLARHPELYFTPEKEIHYFYHHYVDSGLLSETRRLSEAKNRYITNYDPEKANIDRIRNNLHWVTSYLSNPVDDLWYRNLFSGQRRETYRCDFSNLYALLPAEAWSRIAADCDKLRVLYTMRHPVKRLWSHVKFHLQVTQNTGVLDTWEPKQFEKFARQGFLWNNAEYGRALRNMKAGLPEGCLKPIFFEDLHQDQRGTLAGIEDFLGIRNFDYPEQLLSSKVNQSVTHAMPDFFPGLFKDDVARVVEELTDQGLPPPASWTS